MPHPDLPDVDSLRCFVEAARLLNFRAAARAVGLTPAALGQRIKKLEDQFEVPLFHRSTRKVILTEAGMSLLPAAQATLRAAEKCKPAAQGRTGPVEQDITLGTRQELGMSWVLPQLPDLRASFPGVTFHLYFGSGSDLEHRVRGQVIDCAISSRRITDPKLTGIRLHREEYVFVGNTAMLRSNPLDHFDEANNHTLMDVDETLPLYRYWRDAAGGEDSLGFNGLVRVGTIAASLQLILDGQGVGVVPRYVAADAIERGELRVLFPQVTPLHDYFRLMFRTDDPRRALYESMAQQLSEQPLRA